MARIDNLTNFLTDVADAIRSKTGSSETIAAEDFDTEIESIETGGATLQTKSVTITENTTTNITPDTGYDGLSSVSVTTDVSGEVLPDKYVKFTKWNSNGYPTEAKIEGFTQINDNFFSTASCLYNITNIILPSTITSIGQLAFYGRSNLQTINLPNTLTSIKTQAFQNCSNLETELPNSVTEILNYAFSGCTKLNASTLPSNLTSLYNNSFENCQNVTFSEIPNTVTYFAATNTFYNCKKITISKIPTTAAVMNATATFYGCIAIPKFDYGNGAYLGSSSFYGCTSMVSFIGEKIKSTASTGNSYSAFRGCTALKAVWLGNELTSSGFGRYTFSGCTNITKMYINLPRATVEAFANYQYAFSSYSNISQSLTTDVIICNDDEDFITAEEFRNTDWSQV